MIEVEVSLSQPEEYSPPDRRLRLAPVEGMPHLVAVWIADDGKPGVTAHVHADELKRAVAALEEGSPAYVFGG